MKRRIFAPQKFVFFFLHIFIFYDKIITLLAIKRKKRRALVDGARRDFAKSYGKRKQCSKEGNKETKEGKEIVLKERCTECAALLFIVCKIKTVWYKKLRRIRYLLRCI